MPKHTPEQATTVAFRDDFLRHLSEMEASLERGEIQWTLESAQAALSRVVNVLSDLGAIAARLRLNLPP
jgi:hypothetical protein